MKYRNTKTGYEFETTCICNGADLELVEDEKTETEKKPASKRKSTVKKLCMNLSQRSKTSKHCTDH